MSRRSSVNCSLIDSLSRIRMTASSPCTLGMIETRKSIVLPGIRSLKRPSCGTRFSAMSSSTITLKREMIELWDCLELGLHLDAVDNRAVELLADRPHRLLQPAVAALLHVVGRVLGFDLDVARPP